MFMKGVFMLFMSLGLGYALCVLAKKQEGILKTVGYTLGVSILVLSFLYGLAVSDMKLKAMCGMGGPAGYMSKVSKSMSGIRCPFTK